MCQNAPFSAHRHFHVQQKQFCDIFPFVQTNAYAAKKGVENGRKRSAIYPAILVWSLMHATAQHPLISRTLEALNTKGMFEPVLGSDKNIRNCTKLTKSTKLILHIHLQQKAKVSNTRRFLKYKPCAASISKPRASMRLLAVAVDAVK